MSQADYQAQANAAAAQYNVPPALYSALINQESGWNPYAVGSSGEVGLTQIMAGTASDLGITNRWDVSQQLSGGASYLSQLYNKFGNWYDALRAYNAGPGAAGNSSTVSANYANTILNAAGMSGTSTAASVNSQSPAPIAGNISGGTINGVDAMGNQTGVQMPGSSPASQTGSSMFPASITQFFTDARAKLDAIPSWSQFTEGLKGSAITIVVVIVILVLVIVGVKNFIEE